MSRPLIRSEEHQKNFSDQMRRASEKSKSGCVLVLLFFSSLLTFAIILAI
jgi:hypothetical protein